MRTARANRLTSQITAIGTYTIVSPRSAAANIALAFGPRTPPPAAWKTRACVSVTAAESATAPPGCFSQGRVRSRRFFGDERPADRRGERLLEIRVGGLEAGVPWGDVNRADHRPRGCRP